MLKQSLRKMSLHLQVVSQSYYHRLSAIMYFLQKLRIQRNLFLASMLSAGRVWEFHICAWTRYVPKEIPRTTGRTWPRETKREKRTDHSMRYIYCWFTYAFLQVGDRSRQDDLRLTKPVKRKWQSIGYTATK